MTVKGIVTRWSVRRGFLLVHDPDGRHWRVRWELMKDVVGRLEVGQECELDVDRTGAVTAIKLIAPKLKPDRPLADTLRLYRG